MCKKQPHYCLDKQTLSCFSDYIFWGENCKKKRKKGIKTNTKQTHN